MFTCCRTCLVYFVLCLGLAWPVQGKEGGPSENLDLEIGGPGSGEGKFLELRDLTFDPQNQLYVLDGGEVEASGKRKGNFLVQRFDPQGKFQAQFSIFDESLGTKNEPARLAVDSRGQVYITQPKANLVQQFSRTGERLQQIAISNAFALTIWNRAGREQLLVVGARYQQNRWQPIAEAHVLNLDGSTAQVIPLSQPVSQCVDAAVDRAGHFYLLGEVRQIYKYDETAKLLGVLGGGTSKRTEDGSELRHTLALDSAGNLYAQAYNRIARFEPTWQSVGIQPAEFYWYDAWSPHDAYVAYAIDRNDRFWFAATGQNDGSGRHHFRPCVGRVKTNFFAKLKIGSTRLLGLDAAVKVARPYNISYDFSPVPVEFSVKPGFRQVKEITVDWRAYDLLKTEAVRGQFNLALTDGLGTNQMVSFQPNRWGWYTFEFHLSTRGEPLMGVGAHLGVTPQFSGLPTLAEGESPGGWNDIPRTAFCGLKLHRIHTRLKPAELEKELQLAQRYGVTLLVQFENAADCAPEKVRAVVTAGKGKVRYWEVVNEPNFTLSPEKYVALLKTVYPLIKEIDPEAQVLAPAVCGLQLPWHEKFYEHGGGKVCDILSVHDYEGDESIDPGHWRWKFGELRRLMSRYGDANKPIWQTERAIGGVRGNTYLGGVQAVRVTLQRDVLETLGIPNEHNLHYYLNQGGYSSVPTYLWSDVGPHPAALAVRTRQAMTQGRPYAGTIDFGPTGNKLFLGLRFESTEGGTLSLRNLGCTELPLDLEVVGFPELVTTDSFGNEQKHSVREGRVRLLVPSLPIYIQYRHGQSCTVPKLDFGRNLAATGTFKYSAPTKTDFALLANGQFEATHAGNPLQGKYWTGELPSVPQELELRFVQPQPISRVLVFTVRADNPHCALLDYDLQYEQAGAWTTLQEVRSPIPASDLVRSPDSAAHTWYLDQNFFVHDFKPIRTGALRLVVRRATHGFLPDAQALKAWGNTMGSRLQLREIEVYGASTGN